MQRLAYTLAHRCREHLFHRDQLARLLTLFDHWVVVLGPIGVSDPEDDGSAKILRDVARRYRDRVNVLESAHPWPREVDAVRAVQLLLREHLTDQRPEAYLWRVDPWEVWELEALKGAEHELDRRRLDAGTFLSDCYLGDKLLLRGEIGEGRGKPYPRLWRWRGELCSERDPLAFPTHYPAELLAPRFDSYRYRLPDELTTPDLHHQVRARWDQLHRRPVSDFPLPLAELLGPTGPGLTQSYLHHHDQTQPIPSALR